MVHPNQARYGAKVTTVDPASGYVGVVMKGDAQERQVLHVTHAPASAWPMVGENWIVVQRNGTWYLESKWPQTTSFQNVGPGDAMLHTATGIVHVLDAPNNTNQQNYSTTAIYAVNDIVLYNHKLYQSLINNNLNNQPDDSPNIWQIYTGSFTFTAQSFPARGTGTLVFASSTTANVTIPHEMSIEPTSINITPLINGAPSFQLTFSVGTITDTTFVVSALASTTTSATIKFSWMALI